jgi:hypothetical protein
VAKWDVKLEIMQRKTPIGAMKMLKNYAVNTASVVLARFIIQMLKNLQKGGDISGDK